MLRQGRLVALLLCLPAAAPAVAQFNQKWTEAPFLPEYCRHTMLGSVQDPDMVAHYRAIYGEVAFSHMHHYCQGLHQFFEALQLRDNQMLRNTNFTEAIGNIDYVLVRTGPDFILRPELLARKAAALLALDRAPEAAACLAEAIELNPAYVPAYVSLGGQLARAGDLEAARKTYRDGLAQVPDSEILQRKLAELDGAAPAH